MKEYIKTGLVLMIYMVIAGFLVAFVYNAVTPAINNAEFNAKLKAIKSVLTDANTQKLLVEKIPQNEEELNKFVWQKSSDLLYKDEKSNKIYSPAFKFTSGNKEIYVLTISGIGFGGDVVSVVSFIKENGKTSLNKIEVINYSQETPGLGANIAEETVKKRFYSIPYSGLKSGLKVDKDSGVKVNSNEKEKFSAQGIVITSDIMTGATITPRGVVNSINAAVKYLTDKGVM